MVCRLRFISTPTAVIFSNCLNDKHRNVRGLSAPFRTCLDEDLASAIATRVVNADTVAASRLSSGRTVRILVPKTPPESAHGSPRDLAELRRRAQSTGAIVRPCLVDTLTESDKLYDYQLKGTQWLKNRRTAILADDMGLGKTVQTISALRMLFRERPLNSALIVCPKQLMSNWENELSKWAPELSWCRLTPPTRWRTEAWTRIFNHVHVIVTNYESVASVLRMDRAFDFSILVLDEAHRVRNSSAQVTSDLRNLTRERTWALTGTPLERTPSDLWTILSVIQPGRFNPALMPPSDEALRARSATIRPSQVENRLSSWAADGSNKTRTDRTFGPATDFIRPCLRPLCDRARPAKCWRSSTNFALYVT